MVASDPSAEPGLVLEAGWSRPPRSVKATAELVAEPTTYLPRHLRKDTRVRSAASRSNSLINTQSWKEFAF